MAIPKICHFIAFAGILVVLPACIPVAYILPEYRFVPPINTKTPDSEVKVFCLKHTSKRTVVGLISGSFKFSNEYCLSTLPVDQASKKTMAQHHWTVSKGTFVFPIYSNDEGQSITVLAYKDGYKTLTIDRWSASSNLDWQEVSSIGDQEKSLDELWNGETWKDRCEEEQPKFSSPFSLTKFTGNSRDNLLWLAERYDSLAQAALTSVEVNQDPLLSRRLTNKAKLLRHFAGVITSE